MTELDWLFEDATWGAELEIGQCNGIAELPEGNKWCSEEDSVHSKCGVHIDPKKYYSTIGGEIQVKVCNSEQELSDLIEHLYNITNTEIVGPSSIHMHIRVPKLLESPNLFMHLCEWLYLYEGMLAKSIISPLPELEPPEFYDSDEEYKFFKNYYKMIHNVRHKSISSGDISRLKKSYLHGDSVKDMIENLYPVNKKTGQKMYHLKPRTSVNIIKIRSLETIEFRSFIGSTDKEFINNIVRFPRQMINAALNNIHPLDIFKRDQFPQYCGWGSRELYDSTTARIARLTYSRLYSYQEIVDNVKNLLDEGLITLEDLGNPPAFR